MSERVRTLSIALVLIVVVCAVSATMALLLVPDFSGDVNRVFVAGPPLNSVTEGLNFIEHGTYDGGAVDVGAGIRLALLGLLAVGIPLGVCATVLTTGNRRSTFDQQWRSVFQMGFVVQLASLVLAAAALLLMGPDGLKSYTEAPLFTLMLVGDIVVGALGLPRWRCLQETSVASQQPS